MPLTSEALQPTCVGCASTSGMFRDLWEQDRTYRLWGCDVCATESWKRVSQQEGVTSPSEYWDLQRFESYEGHDVVSEYWARYDALGRLSGLSTTEMAASRIADWGGGIGNLAAWGKAKGAVDVTVLDTDDRALEVARGRGLDTMLVDELDDDCKFDVIFAIDVIEHVVDPAAFLGQLRDHLSATGRIVLETPSSRFWMRSLGRREQPPVLGPKLRRYLYYFEHKHYFSSAGLTELARSCNFDVHATTLTGSPRSKIAAAVVSGESLPRRSARSLLSTSLALVGRNNKIWTCLVPAT